MWIILHSGLTLYIVPITVLRLKISFFEILCWMMTSGILIGSLKQFGCWNSVALGFPLCPSWWMIFVLIFVFRSRLAKPTMERGVRGASGSSRALELFYVVCVIKLSLLPLKTILLQAINAKQFIQGQHKDAVETHRTSVKNWRLHGARERTDLPADWLSHFWK